MSGVFDFPEPDANSPEQCRFVSEISRRLEGNLADGFADWERGLTAREWGQRAVRIEREQVIERAARVLIVPQRAMTWDEAGEFERNDVRNMARALADAGLLKIDGGCTR